MSSGRSCKDSNARFRTVPVKPYSEQNVENTVVQMTRYIFSSGHFSIASYKQKMRKSLLRQSVSGHRCESGIVIFAGRVT